MKKFVIPLYIILLCIIVGCKKPKNTEPPISKCYKGLLLYPDVHGFYVDIQTTDNIGEVWKPFGGPNEYKHVILIKGSLTPSTDVMVRGDTIYFKLILDKNVTCNGSPNASPGVVPIFPANTIKEQYCATHLSKTSCQ
jgi:hypothetical protein